MSRIHAHRLIEAAVVVTALPIGNTPTNESQARVLTDLEPDQQKEVWTKVVDTVPSNERTAASIKAVKAEMLSTAQRIKTDDRRRREDLARENYRLKAQSAPWVCDQYKIIHSDMREVDIPECSVDAIVTDPPYSLEFIETFRWLAEHAVVWLKDGASMLVMSGHCYLPKVFEYLCAVPGLNFQWTLRYELVGENQPFIGRRIYSGWKPIVWMVKGRYSGRSFGDTVKSTFEDERHHKWGQTESGLRALVERISDPGQIVLDPFCGGGSTGVACVQLNRQFIGIDIDIDSVNTTLSRLSHCLSECSAAIE